MGVQSTITLSAGADTKAAINGFGRIGRNVLRCWLGREQKGFDIVAINAGSMSPQTTAHLLKYDTVLGTLKEDLIKVVMWYDNEWGYSQRVIDLTDIVSAKLTVEA